MPSVPLYSPQQNVIGWPSLTGKGFIVNRSTMSRTPGALHTVARVVDDDRRRSGCQRGLPLCRTSNVATPRGPRMDVPRRLTVPPDRPGVRKATVPPHTLDLSVRATFRVAGGYLTESRGDIRSPPNFTAGRGSRRLPIGVEVSSDLSATESPRAANDVDAADWQEVEPMGVEPTTS